MKTEPSHSSPSLLWPLRRHLFLMLALFGLAVALALAAPAGALPPIQDSPLAPQDEVSPLSTPTVTAVPTASPAEPVPPPATPTPPPAAPSAPAPRLSVAGLAAIMAVIAVIALIIGLRRK